VGTGGVPSVVIPALGLREANRLLLRGSPTPPPPALLACLPVCLFACVSLIQSSCVQLNSALLGCGPPLAAVEPCRRCVPRLTSVVAAAFCALRRHLHLLVLCARCAPIFARGFHARAHMHAQPMEDVWKRLGVPVPATRDERGATPFPDVWSVPRVLAVPPSLHSIKDHRVPPWCASRTFSCCISVWRSTQERCTVLDPLLGRNVSVLCMHLLPHTRTRAQMANHDVLFPYSIEHAKAEAIQ
jgi:hypothetical protein